MSDEAEDYEAVEDESRGCVLGLDIWAVVAVYPDGTEVWWVADERDGAPGGQGCACAKCAPHDQLEGDPEIGCGLTESADADGDE